jgi:curved DNA-binding protein CbpA
MSDRAERDLYALLGLPRGATAREIRRAYRRLARQHHPDLNPGSDGSQRFAALATAYAILRDPARRARYDRELGPPSAERSGSSPRPPVRPASVRGGDVRRGILELSREETMQLTSHGLALRDVHGRTLVLPQGTKHGDQITVLHGGRVAVLTVWTPATS